jgi:transcriptional regulator with XRE-family HTH domain
LAEPTPTAATSAVSAVLARRLRDLRHSRFSRRLTQSEVAQALSQDEPAGVSTLSAYEHLRTPTLPPERRLATYALFFATERSLDPEPHLVPLEELSEAEDEARRDLERELLRLRMEEIGDPLPTPARHASWRFTDGYPITIICAELTKSDEITPGPFSEVDNPNYTRLYSFADADALMELFGHLKATNPNSSINYRLASRVTGQDLTNHIVLLGGIAWNDVARRLNDSASLPIRQVRNEKIHSGEVFEIEGGENHGQQFLPRFQKENSGTAEKPGVLLEDVALLARVPNPFNAHRTLTYCNGIHSRGVLGAVRCLTDPDVRDENERYLEENFPDPSGFVILTRVQVLGAETISPSFGNPGAVLYRSPEAEFRN